MHERVRRGSRLFAAAALLILAARVGAATAAATAAEPADGGASAVLIGGTSTCPSPAAVRTEVETLVPRDRLDTKLRAVGVGPSAPVEIFDLGVPFRVIAAGSVREYRDEARDCAYRARVAAVFVALVIDPAANMPARSVAPPEVVKAAPAAVPPPRRAPASSSSSSLASAGGAGAAARAHARLDLGAGAEAGLGPEARVGQVGLALQLAIGGGRFALAVGAAALAPGDTTVGGVRLHQWRLPADVGVRMQGQLDFGGRPLLAPYGELGLGVALLQERALDLAAPQTHTALELGLRADVGLHLATSSRVTPFLALHAVLVPSPPTILALPRGAVGHTPTFWVGAAAGASWGLF